MRKGIYKIISWGMIIVGIATLSYYYWDLILAVTIMGIGVKRLRG